MRAEAAVTLLRAIVIQVICFGCCVPDEVGMQRVLSKIRVAGRVVLRSQYKKYRWFGMLLCVEE